jgi:hypothetical protein
VIHGGSASLETMPNQPPKARERCAETVAARDFYAAGAHHCQRVEDNAFHLAHTRGHV